MLYDGNDRAGQKKRQHNALQPPQPEREKLMLPDRVRQSETRNQHKDVDAQKQDLLAAKLKRRQEAAGKDL